MQFHVIAFEGPDAYSCAGGIASRVTGLAEALADSGFDTHLWFVGDPQQPGHETRGRLQLHRWCQWISAYHPHGVYDGEDGKRSDLAASLPPFLFHDILAPNLRLNEHPAVILAEEWHTVDAVLHLDWLLRHVGLRDRATIFWNANNTFGFDRIDWRRLDRAAVITTVSRYMRYRMWTLGVDPLVVPNGLSADALEPPEKAAVSQFRNRLKGRTVLGKVARWDPDKRWLLAIATVVELKRRGERPLLIARGGMESHCHEVLQEAADAGLRVTERNGRGRGAYDLLQSLNGLENVDVVNLRSHLDPAARRVLFRGADAILANSGHEPFGLVGLETMGAGGLACTGGTGEDYAVPGWNALVLQSTYPREFVTLFQSAKAKPSYMRALRRHGVSTARQYAWRTILERALLPRIASGSNEGAQAPVA
jgi:glycosyltransferase involved in cell wall biosynthesis